MSGLAVQRRRAVMAMALYAADHVVRERACDADKDGTAENQTDSRFKARQREYEPGEESDNTGDEDHHDKRPPQPTTFWA